MAETLKAMFFQPEFIQALGESLREENQTFDTEKFTECVFNENWARKELKQRMYHVTTCVHNTLLMDYPEALTLLMIVAPKFKGFDSMVFPDYVEKYGLDYFNLSMPALKFFTPLCSSEFAVRPFIKQDPGRAMAYMQEWAEDENPSVRRLASEGCRPRLPWAMALPEFKQDPTPILPILEKLKYDESESVRRSVANNLNDISKDNPEIVLDISERWYGQSEDINWIVKHACRSMLKAGNKRALVLFGFGDPVHIRVEDLRLDNNRPAIGEDIHFTYTLIVDSEEQLKTRLEYAAYYQKARGKLSKKVFQHSEKDFQPGTYKLKKKHSFKDMSTRLHYPGEHQIAIIVNGEEKARIKFELAG